MPFITLNRTMKPDLSSILAIKMLDDANFIRQCKDSLDSEGTLVIPDFFSPEAIHNVLQQSVRKEPEAYFANSTHNVYLTPVDVNLPSDHTYNRQVISSKALIADDQIPADSPLRIVYDSTEFRRFLSQVLGIEQIYPYADEVSSINVHFAPEGKELGWHFDNSSFAVTMLLQAPVAGGVFEYVPNARNADAGEMGFEKVAAVLDGNEPVQQLEFGPGDLVLFRGRDSMHRVTPTEGEITRMLVVFAYNNEPGIGLSESALQTFYGRTS